VPERLPTLRRCVKIETSASNDVLMPENHISNSVHTYL